LGPGGQFAYFESGTQTTQFFDGVKLQTIGSPLPLTAYGTYIIPFYLSPDGTKLLLVAGNAPFVSTPYILDSTLGLQPVDFVAQDLIVDGQASINDSGQIALLDQSPLLWRTVFLDPAKGITTMIGTFLPEALPPTDSVVLACPIDNQGKFVYSETITPAHLPGTDVTIAVTYNVWQNGGVVATLQIPASFANNAGYTGQLIGEINASGHLLGAITQPVIYDALGTPTPIAVNWTAEVPNPDPTGTGLGAWSPLGLNDAGQIVATYLQGGQLIFLTPPAAPAV